MAIPNTASSIFRVPKAVNEPVLNYGPGSPEKLELKKALDYHSKNPVEIPVIINGKEIKTGDIVEIRAPHNHDLLLGTYHRASEEHVNMAAKAASEAWREWSYLPWEDRVSIFLKAADLLTGPWRARLNAITMLGQSKTAHQAEIEAVCELSDFWRFNAEYVTQLYQDQPISVRGIWNRVEYRPLEGFVFAVTPFNFTAIAGNLPTAPAMMGNTVLWKPASSAVLNSYHLMMLFKEAGLPDGVINLLPGSGGKIGNPVIKHKDLAGIHFTGSTEVFQQMWRTIGENIDTYKAYPRIVGETGGKDYIFAHPDCDVDGLAVAIARGGYEYQGQKCSAASRVYVPKSIWEDTKQKLLRIINEDIKMGDIADFRNFMGAVIDRNAFDNIKSYIDYAKEAKDATIIAGGTCDDSKGFFIEPTVIVADDPHFKTMEEEIFGPVVTIYVYEDKELSDTLDTLKKTSMYALTGAIFARDRKDISHLANELRDTAGNFYINDKPTGAVVGQQPFGGARKSGTNDKAGSMQNLLRWVSVRSVKENFVAPHRIHYPYMDEE